jgi:biopolymer transport protein ExbD
MSSIQGESDNLLAQALAVAAPEDEQERKRKPLPHRREITLNLVAMLDMTFQLLFFFLLTTNFAAAEGVLSANLPAGDAATADPSPFPRLPLSLNVHNISATATRITLEIKGGSTKEINDYGALAHELMSRQGKDTDGKYIAGASATLRGDDPVVIVPDADVSWGDVVAVFNAAMRSGLSSVSFAPAND